MAQRFPAYDGIQDQIVRIGLHVSQSRDLTGYESFLLVPMYEYRLPGTVLE